jgi:TPR repeat protein
MRFLFTGIAAAALIGCSAAAEGSDLSRRLEQLAAGGNAEAAYHLGMLHNNGIGVAQDPRRAFEHFRRAAEGGDPLGAYKLGCYYAGQFGSEVVRPDEAQALRWKLVAARAGYSLAQLDVGSIHARNGRWAEAVSFWESAARQGEPQALHNLSAVARDGRAGSPSRPRAWAYLVLAQAAAGRGLTPESMDQLEQLFEEMTAAERAESQRIGETFLTGPTELTRRAMSGVERAERVAAGGGPPS